MQTTVRDFVPIVGAAAAVTAAATEAEAHERTFETLKALVIALPEERLLSLMREFVARPAGAAWARAAVQAPAFFPATQCHMGCARVHAGESSSSKSRRWPGRRSTLTWT